MVAIGRRMKNTEQKKKKQNPTSNVRTPSTTAQAFASIDGLFLMRTLRIGCASQTEAE